LAACSRSSARARILAGEKLYDVWQVNQDAEYHEAGEAGEEKGATGLRLVPIRRR
jgi:hypothetical protein